MLEMILIILEQTLIHIPLMCAAYISFSLLKVPDLSLESAYVSGALATSVCLSLASSVNSNGLLLVLLIFVSLLSGALVGLVSGVLTRLLSIPHLLSAIITNGIFWGINQIVIGTYLSLSGLRNPLIVNLIARHPELPLLLLIGIVIMCVMFFVCHTQLGYSFAVFGTAPHFFRHYGINAHYVFIVGLSLSNALAGLTGYLFAQSTGFADINMGLGKTLFCITALMLGKAVCVTKKPIFVSVPIIGGTFYFVMQQLLLKVGFNLKYFTMVQALLVLCILIVHARKSGETIDHLGV